MVNLKRRKEETQTSGKVKKGEKQKRRKKGENRNLEKYLGKKVDTLKRKR